MVQFLFSFAKQYYLRDSVKMSITLGRPTSVFLSQASIDSSGLCNDFRITRRGLLRTETPMCDYLRASTPTEMAILARLQPWQDVGCNMGLDDIRSPP